MLTVLLRYRLRSLRNTARFSTPRQRALSAALGVFGLIFALALFAGFRIIMLVRGEGAAGAALAQDVIFFTFLFLLAGSVPFISGTLLYPGDLPLLGVAPVPPWSIVAERLIHGTMAGAAQFLPIGAPAVIACACAMSLPLALWPLVLLLSVLLVLMPACITGLLLVTAVTAFGPGSVRRAVAAVNVLLGSVVCLTAVGQVTRLRLHEGLAGLAIGSAEPMAMTHIPPWAWLAQALPALAAGDVSAFAAHMVRSVVVVILLVSATLYLGDRLIRRGDLAGDPEGNVRVNGSRLAVLTDTSRVRALSGPFWAMMRKESRYLQRDSLLLSQLAMPAILYFVPYVMSVYPAIRVRVSTDELFAFAVLMVMTILYMQASILSASAIGLEGRAFWVYLVSPNRARTALQAKWLSSWALSGASASVMLVLAGIAFRADAAAVAALVGALLLSAAGMCGIGVGVSAALPKFTYENPAHRVSPWAIMIGFAAGVAYSGATWGTLAAAWYIGISVPRYATAVHTWGIALAGALTLLCVIGPLVVGSRAIGRYQWEH